ncbi:MAG TPA: PASTA domain-containing protein [Acidimicrobiia bacterium]|nr:PASTA domain-containing protein [Acidimicrobiia bacterium]
MTNRLERAGRELVDTIDVEPTALNVLQQRAHRRRLLRVGVTAVTTVAVILGAVAIAGAVGSGSSKPAVIHPVPLIPTTTDGTVLVPNVLGLSDKDAIARLEQLGFQAKVFFEANDVDRGFTVVRQTPAAGQSAARGTVITLTVATRVGTPSTIITPLHLGDADNGHTVQARVGQEIDINLDSTYWQFDTTLNRAIVDYSSGGVTVVTTPGCVPGGGCGTITGHFIARAVGTAVISASRTSCGEALACAPAQSHWSVTIHVTAPPTLEPPPTLPEPTTTIMP